MEDQEKTEKKTYECELCGKIMKTHHTHSLHVKKHAKEKDLKCEICGKTFRQAVNLRDHRMLHTGERPYECDTCGERFIAARTLARHIMSHTGDRPYKCGDCGKGFKESAKLKRHIRTLHSELRPFKCERCECAYGDKSDLKVHMRKHDKVKSNYRRHVCHICGMQFVSNPVLERHIRQIHEGETRIKYVYNKKKKKMEPIRFHCTECSKSYAHECDLKRHVKTHTDPQTYSCPCGKTYAMEKILKTHMRFCRKSSKMKPKKPQRNNKRNTECSAKNANSLRYTEYIKEENFSSDESDSWESSEQEPSVLGSLEVKQERVEDSMVALPIQEEFEVKQEDLIENLSGIIWQEIQQEELDDNMNKKNATVRTTCNTCFICIAGFLTVHDLMTHYFYNH